MRTQVSFGLVKKKTKHNDIRGNEENKPNKIYCIYYVRKSKRERIQAFNCQYYFLLTTVTTVFLKLHEIIRANDLKNALLYAEYMLKYT